MLAPAKHRFSVSDYYRMAETGVLHPDARVELLNGEITDMSPIGPFHGGVVNYLTEHFVSACKGRWTTTVQNALRLDDYSEPEPDVTLLKRSPDFYRGRHPGPDDVFLLIEVADSSLDRDQQEKVPAYARAGIKEVWIVDLNEEVIEVYRQPSQSGYASKKVLGRGENAAPQAFPDAAVDVADLLKR